MRRFCAGRTATAGEVTAGAGKRRKHARLDDTVSCMPSGMSENFASIAGRIVSEHEVPVVFHN